LHCDLPTTVFFSLLFAANVTVLFQGGALDIVKRVDDFVDNVTSIGFLLWLTVHIPGVP